MIYMFSEPYWNAIMMITNNGGTWSEPQVINAQLGGVRDCQVSSLSHDGKTMLLARSDPFDSDIYISYFDEGRWSRIEKLSKSINSVYLESHACLSSDGKVLYFTSRRRGGYWGLDMNYFIAIQGVRRIQGEDGLYRYLFGEFETVAEANKVLPGIKAIGYPDAFITNLSRYQSALADNSELR